MGVAFYWELVEPAKLAHLPIGLRSAFCAALTAEFGPDPWVFTSAHLRTLRRLARRPNAQAADFRALIKVIALAPDGIRLHAQY